MADNRDIAFAAAKKLIHDFIVDLDYDTSGRTGDNVCTYTHGRTNFAKYLKKALDKVGIASVLVGDDALEVNYDKSDKDKILAITNDSLRAAYDSARGAKLFYTYQVKAIKEPIVEPIKVAPKNIKKKSFYMEKVHQPGMLNYNFQFKYKLSAKDLDIILPHYDKKHHIKIFKNGTTEVYAQEILKRRQSVKDEDVCLNKDECIAEILQIQKTLKPGEQVGYMFTNGHNVEGGHFEAVIITSESIIRPVVWGMDSSESMDGIPGAYHTEITSAIVPGLKKGEGIRPQVTGALFSIIKI